MSPTHSADPAFFDVAQLDAGTVYRLLSGAIAPRPIAWVSTVDAEGNANLAPFSFFNVASVDPPVLAFAPLLDDRAMPKDTVRNLETVRECVVHIGSEDLIEALNATSATLPPDGDEFTHAGLGKAPLGELKPPRIAEAPIAFGCRVRDVLSFGDRPRSGRLVLAEVVAIHADPGVWDGRHVSREALRPVGRLAGADYVRTTDVFALERPS
ncbi:flavin reductase family protein [Modicisalibacter xianhensis]|uniref:NADH-FMN oxidoreductase RutF, flavin reductase (DIM6/NTAB) family n=1 Tax=Modicisalibacter xianhensis TaxID=442341 RepID=A0A1I3D3E2_9GAMM|nr:flavin reductase family protein [Halomonas xianhensis]SFH81260.1 NADH-FMN oxidoreductase RutF, flavin reductase (DIM6/NTAB) family [Halomonas xianhensis]